MSEAHKMHLNKVIAFMVTSNINPVMIEDSYVPYDLFKDLTVGDMENSKFNYIENICGIKINGNYETSYEIMLDKEIRQLLCLTAGKPILMSTTHSYNTYNQFINYAIIYRNSEEHIYELHLKKIIITL